MHLRVHCIIGLLRHNKGELTMLISIANDYTDTPGGRLKAQGEYSGESFREIFLEPHFNNDSDEIITINIDGVYGYPPSFLDEAFGGLAREYGADIVKRRLHFISNEEPSLVEKIEDYITGKRKA